MEEDWLSHPAEEFVTEDFRGQKGSSLRLKEPAELAPDDARDHEAIIIADAKKGKSKGRPLAHPILGIGRPTTIRMLSSMAACRLHCDQGVVNIVDRACANARRDDHLADEGSAVWLTRRRCPGLGRLTLRHSERRSSRR